MVNIRMATVADMMQMQHCNLRNLPENYTFKYYLYHALSWPQLLFVAEDDNGKIVGYVMAKLEDEDEGNKNKPVEAHITSLSVLRTHRKLGIATKLMRAAHHQMKSVYRCFACSLRVRVTNRAAITLYNDVLGYTTRFTEKGYYADGEDALDMQLKFTYPQTASELELQNSEMDKKLDAMLTQESTQSSHKDGFVNFAEENQAA
mmetsp:Transcript_10251/g.17254  ORF Transcript_10251/g.17254 Transcript_10251/m.17254 type:complete len:204 (+) Transcript_10251:16-627(+)